MDLRQTFGLSFSQHKNSYVAPCANSWQFEEDLCQYFAGLDLGPWSLQGDEKKTELAMPSVVAKLYMHWYPQVDQHITWFLKC
jgi:hypothetical protein